MESQFHFVFLVWIVPEIDGVTGSLDESATTRPTVQSDPTPVRIYEICRPRAFLCLRAPQASELCHSLTALSTIESLLCPAFPLNAWVCTTTVMLFGGTGVSVSAMKTP